MRSTSIDHSTPRRDFSYTPPSSIRFKTNEFNNLSELMIPLAMSEQDPFTSIQSFAHFAPQTEIAAVSILIDVLNLKVNEQISPKDTFSMTWPMPPKAARVDNVADLEEITREMFETSSDPELFRILKRYGWTGVVFRPPGLHTLQAQEECLSALQNYYLRCRSGSSDATLTANARGISLRFSADASNSNNFTTTHLNDKRAKLELILPFCPEILLSHLEASKETMVKSPSAVSSFSFNGACMLADISGFSKFSGSMCAKGVGGLDGLREATNLFLAHFIKVVYELNGDVIAFAGDALICVFRNTAVTNQQHVIEDCCFRAIQCGCILREYRTINLSTHIGISYGELKVGLLGGHQDCWTFLLNGECVSALSSCVDEAKSGQLVVTKECFDMAVKACKQQTCASDSEESACPTASISISGDRIDSSADENVLVNSVQEISESLGNQASPTPATRVHNNPFKAEESLLPPSPSPASNDINIHIIGNTSPSASRLLRTHSVGSGKESKSLLSRKTSLASMIPRLPASPQRANKEAEKLAQDYANKLSRVSCFVPRPVLNAVYSETLDSIRELRKVTTMFLNLNSYDAKKHSDPVSLQPFFRMAQEVLHESGGFLRQFLVDDKGCVFIGMWGVPSFTYANNCVRALHCAAAIHQRCAAIDHRCSIGVTTGMVYCGVIGSSLRQDYVGIGTEVNLAARLMSKAQGQILVDMKTYQSLDAMTKELLAPLDHELVLKGIANPVVPYMYAAPSGQLPNISALPDDESVLVTDENKRTITQMVDYLYNNAAQEQGSNVVSFVQSTLNERDYKALCLFVIGEPGTGKQAIISYCISLLRQRNIVCYHLRGTADMEGSPLSLIRALFFEIVDAKKFNSGLRQREQLTSWVDQAFHGSTVKIDRIDMVNCLIEYLDINCYENPDTPVAQLRAMGLVPVAEQHSMDLANHIAHDQRGISSIFVRRKLGEYVFTKVLSVLLRHAPTGIVIEGAHFCGEASWDALYRIQKECSINLMLVLTMRSNGQIYKNTPKTSAQAAKSARNSTGRKRYDRLNKISSPKRTSKAARASETSLNDVASPSAPSVVVTTPTAVQFASSPLALSPQNSIQLSPGMKADLVFPSIPPPVHQSDISSVGNGPQLDITLMGGVVQQEEERHPPVSSSSMTVTRSEIEGEGQEMKMKMKMKKESSDIERRPPPAALLAEWSPPILRVEIENHVCSAANQSNDQVLQTAPLYNSSLSAEYRENNVTSMPSPRSFQPSPRHLSTRKGTNSRKSKPKSPTSAAAQEESNSTSASKTNFKVNNTGEIQPASAPKSNTDKLSMLLNFARSSRKKEKLSFKSSVPSVSEEDGIFQSGHHHGDIESELSRLYDDMQIHSLYDSGQNRLHDEFGVNFHVPATCLAILNHPLTSAIATHGMDSKSLASVLKKSQIEPTNKMIEMILLASSRSTYWCNEIVKFIDEMGVEEVERAFQTGDALQVMITLRLEKLSQPEQMALRYASIIGDEFSEKMLAALFPIKKGTNITSTLSTQLALLVEKGFITQIVDNHESLDCFYKFQNTLLQSNIYNMIPMSDAGQIHHRIAEYLEVTHSENLRPYYPRVGYHYNRSNTSEDNALAFKYYLKAGDIAVLQGSMTEALQLLKIASTLAEDIPELDIVLQVVNMAILDLLSKRLGKQDSDEDSEEDFDTEFSNQLRKSFSGFGHNWPPEAQPFVDLRSHIDDRLTRRYELHHMVSKTSGFDISVSTTERRSLNWEASYTTRKMRHLSASGVIDPKKLSSKKLRKAAASLQDNNNNTTGCVAVRGCACTIS